MRTKQASKWIGGLRIALALIIPSLILVVAGCNDNGEIEPVDYGPETSVAAVNAELNKPIAGMDPNEIHVGQFFHDVTSEDIGAGAAVQISGESGFTVIDREDAQTQIRFLVEEHQYNYKSDGSYDKVTKQHDAILNRLPGSVAPTPTPTATPAASPAANPAMVATASLSPSLAKIFGKVSGLEHIRSLSSEPAVRQTIHRLRTWHERIAPPELVSKRPNCGGLAGCMMDVYHISYNVVSWESGGPVLIQVEEIRSPSVPFFAAELQSCATGLVPIGTANSKVLLRQCKTIVDFTFENSSSSTP